MPGQKAMFDYKKVSITKSLAFFAERWYILRTLVTVVVKALTQNVVSKAFTLSSFGHSLQQAWLAKINKCAANKSKL